MPGDATPDPTLLERLSALDAATVHEALGRRGNLSPRIRPIQQGVRIAGTAVTAQVQPGDNRAIHRAVLAGGPGDILVVSADGHIAGYWGEILAVAAQARGILGLVIDGGCRDVAALRARGFPVWSAGISVHGTVKVQPGVVQEPVAVGDVVVNPADAVVADDDGVVVVPAARLAEVVEAAEARAAREERYMDELTRGGNTLDLMNIPKDDPQGQALVAAAAGKERPHA
jgi:4-hydroxy-4-methyl-2-oxoglutarate aldolase